MRIDKRDNNQLRPITFTLGYLSNNNASVLAEMGNTKVLCVANLENRVPPHRMDIGGWLSCEYNMLPGSTETRKARASKTNLDGRSIEISRLIGRSLRQAINLKLLGNKTINIDCDVIEADAGTRCASINGSYIALTILVANMIQNGQIKMAMLEDVIIRPMAAISIGIVKGNMLTDLTYKEDVNAEVDCNIVGTDKGEIIEFQCTGERKPMSKEEIDQVLLHGQGAIKTIVELQQKALKEAYGIVIHRA